MISIGINGFGRIGKCIFLQLLQDPTVSIQCINAPVLEMKYLEQYLKYDSVHHYPRDFNITIIDDHTFEIEFQKRRQTIHVFRDRNAKNLNWRDYQVSFVFDCTGSYLTTEKCQEHDADFIMMSAPAKDSTKTFVYGVNHQEYQGEKIISAASCTTNCITPVLKWVHEELGGIKCGNFTTIHATTASQYTVDILNKNARTNRSILNNIIPHTTGASSAIAAVIPELKGKIHGTSLRVPVSNVSLVDLNVECGNTSLSLNEVLDKMRNITDERKDVIMVTKDTLVSCDFISTTQPSIVDSKASLDLGDGKYKLMIWYDNEWSYSAQMIRMMKHMVGFSSSTKKLKIFDQMELKEKNVVLRVDFNVPICDGVVTDDYRITSALPTIQKIIEKGAKRLILVSHLGRPKEKNSKDSLKILLPILKKYLPNISFLPDGIHPSSISTIYKEDDFDQESKIYLLENIRFHPEETEYEKKSISSEFKELYSDLGDVFINDAFGCSHRKHFSICGFSHDPSKETGYGYLIQKEIQSLNTILHSPHLKTLVILGGAKIDDKVPILQNLSKKVNTIFLGGGILTSASYGFNETNQQAIIQASQSCRLIWANDGITSTNEYFKWKNHHIPTNITLYDIGSLSSFHLAKLIREHDIIFWNGTMGYTEKGFDTGSEILINTLLEEKSKKVVIGGGDTAGFCNEYLEKHDMKTPSHWHISTGGGASIEYLSDGFLSGIKFI
jgi:glyceraldehyde 3-phosphate dehydrogenase